MDFPALSLDDPKTQGILALAAGLLKASGPSPYPVSLGGALGQGGMAGLSQYVGARQQQTKDQQTNALIGLEQAKALREGQLVAQGQHQMNMQSWALGGMQGAMPTFQPPASSPAAVGPRPQPSQPMLMPTSSTQPMQAPDGATNGPFSLEQLPPEARDAAQMDIAFNGGKGLPGIIQNSTTKIIPQVGMVKWNPQTKDWDSPPGFTRAMKDWKQAQIDVENENTLVQVPLADGRVQEMTKSQKLALAGATNQLKNALPALNNEALSSIQRQLVAEPDQPVSVDINLGGQKAKLTLQPLKGMPGFTSGQSTEARSAAEKSGTNAGDVQSQIDIEANGALQSRRILNEMRGLSQDFTQGKVAPFKRALGEWAQALNLPGDWKTEIKGAESQQALQKLTAQMATAAMKQFTNRGTQMEFGTFLKNNPNAELTPGGFQKVLEFMDNTANTSIQKQQAYIEWRKNNPVERSQDFLAEWNKKQNEGLVEDGPKSAPKKGAIVDGWEFLGGDPAQRMNWRKK